jgi:ceramide glucosyltransferase
MSLVALAWALFVAGASFTALFSARRRRRAPARAFAKRILLLRPCAGHERGLDARLAVSGGADLVVFAVESALDPAATAAHRAARTLRDRGTMTLVVHTHATGANRKAAQLAKALERVTLQEDVIVVVADSDVDLTQTDLYTLAGGLDDETVGATWAPPIEAGTIETKGDVLARAVLGASLHAFPLLAGIDRTGMVGKLFAVRARALADAGGFASLVDRLGEDVALARALRTAGWKVRVASVVAPSTASGRSAPEVIARLARWVQVVRSERPWLLPSYPLLFAPTPLAIAALASGLGLGDRILTAAGALALVSRLAVAGGSVRDVVVGDAALLVAFARALSSSTFTWRGRRLRIGRGGRLQEEGAGEERQDPFRRAGHEGRTTRMDQLEVVGRSEVDASELARDGVSLQLDVVRSARLADRDPELGRLRAPEHVTHPDGQHASGLRPSSDVRGAGPEIERRERGALSALGVDPHGAPWTIEEARGVAHGLRAVARIIEAHAERSDEREERDALEVSGIHHRVGFEVEKVGDEQSDERVPPRRVIRDDEQRSIGRRGTCAFSAVDEHPTEGRPDARACLGREPAVEEGRSPRGDHRRTP